MPRRSMSGDLWDCYTGGACERFEGEGGGSSADWSLPREVTFTPCDDGDSRLVNIYESKQHVFSPTGTRVWEASLLLCSYIHARRDTFLRRDVCELGCGAALPSLYLLSLRKQCHTLDGGGSGSASGKLCITDCDVEVLDSLYENLVAQSVGASSALGRVVVDMLDWARPRDCDALSDCDLIIGSALVYLGEHALHLSNLIATFLTSADKQREVVIIQIRDRSGWDDLILQLTSLNVSFICEEVTEEMYFWAQNISSRLIKTSETFYVLKQFCFPTDLVSSTTESFVTTKREDFVVLKCYNII